VKTLNRDSMFVEVTNLRSRLRARPLAPVTHNPRSARLVDAGLISG
jgi:hypothetical protein